MFGCVRGRIIFVPLELGVFTANACCMKALVYEAFGAPPKIASVPDPTPEPHGVVVRVMASGLCRSDWHGWQGHDADITLPHVPGHELAGIVEAVGAEVTRWRPGARVTVPFVGGCGACGQCASGNQQVCDNQFQPGFTHWGSFAEYVSLHQADLNLVSLPEDMTFAAAASLGCRFVTAFRAVVHQGRVQPGDWVAVHGAGGVGLSAVMIAAALGARVVAVDVSDEALELATKSGAELVLNARAVDDVPEAITELTDGGAHVSLDALGAAETCANSIKCLRTRGRHVQVGLLAGADADPALPMGQVIARELELVGSHGMQAHRYDEMFAMMADGRLRPGDLIGREIALDAAGEALMAMDKFQSAGITVITKF